MSLLWQQYDNSHNLDTIEKTENVEKNLNKPYLTSKLHVLHVFKNENV